MFVRIDSAPLGIGLRPLISATLNVPEVVTHPFIWGTAPAEANGERMGDLPASGEWVQLAVPMSRAGLGGRRIDGLAFAIFGGEGPSQVTWGHAGKASNGLETVWVGDARSLARGSAEPGPGKPRATPASPTTTPSYGLPIVSLCQPQRSPMPDLTPAM